MRDKELEFMYWTSGILLSIIGVLIAFAGGIVSYVLKQIRDFNTSEHTEMKEYSEDINTKVEDIDTRLVVLETKHEERSNRCGK